MSKWGWFIVVGMALLLLSFPLSCGTDTSDSPPETPTAPSAEAETEGMTDDVPEAEAEDDPATSENVPADLAGQIIFFLSTQEDDNSPTIVTMWAVDPNGGEPVRIVNSTGNPATSKNFNLSPDCSRLLFTRLPEDRRSPGPYPLMIMNTDGSNQVQISGDSADIAKWMPDGASIILGQMRRDLAPQERPMQVTRADTSGAVLGSWTVPGQVGSIAMSPDGTRIAVSRLLPGASRYQMFIMDLDTGTLTEVGAGYEYYLEEPVWSPDGSRFAFIATDHMTSEIWVANAATAEVQILWTPELQGSSAGIPPTGGLAWAFDGKTVAFMLAPSALMGIEKSMSLMVTAADGSYSRSVLEIPGHGDIMGWSNCAQIPAEIASY